MEGLGGCVSGSVSDDRGISVVEVVEVVVVQFRLWWAVGGGRWCLVVELGDWRKGVAWEMGEVAWVLAGSKRGESFIGEREIEIVR